MAKDTNMILLLGAAGVGGYLWYTGKLASFGLPGPSSTPATPPAPPLTTAQQANAILAAQQAAGSGSGTNAPAVPALGTTVKSAADVAAQAAAKDAYILPDAATFTTFAQTPLNGYQAFSLTDYPNVLLRQDVWATANTQVGSTGTPLSLKDLQALMTKSGLSGLGDFRRHMFVRSGRAA